jgi:hypothetical protein
MNHCQGIAGLGGKEKGDLADENVVRRQVLEVWDREGVLVTLIGLENLRRMDASAHWMRQMSFLPRTLEKVEEEVRSATQTKGLIVK